MLGDKLLLTYVITDQILWTTSGPRAGSWRPLFLFPLLPPVEVKQLTLYSTPLLGRHLCVKAGK